jgi:hypothetical protein
MIITEASAWTVDFIQWSAKNGQTITVRVVQPRQGVQSYNVEIAWSPTDNHPGRIDHPHVGFQRVSAAVRAMRKRAEECGYRENGNCRHCGSKIPNGFERYGLCDTCSAAQDAELDALDRDSVEYYVVENREYAMLKDLEFVKAHEHIDGEWFYTVRKRNGIYDAEISLRLEVYYAVTITRGLNAGGTYLSSYDVSVEIKKDREGKTTRRIGTTGTSWEPKEFAVYLAALQFMDTQMNRDWEPELERLQGLAAQRKAVYEKYRQPREVIV